MEFTTRRLMRGCMALAGAAALMAGAAINAHAQFQGIYGAERTDAAEGGIIQSGDEFVAVGYSDSYGNDRDVYVVKTDKCGNIVWARTIDFGGEDVGRKIRETPDGNYVIVGYTENRFNCCTHDDAFLFELDRNGGGINWASTYGGLFKDQGMDLQIDRETGNIYACGQTSSFGAGDYDAWLFKTDRGGGLLWSRVYGGRSTDLLNSLTIGCSGTVIGVGSTRSATRAGDEQIYVVKADANDGSIIGGWPKHYGNKGDESAWSVVPYRDGELRIVGRTNNFGGRNEEYGLAINCEDGSRIIDRAFWGSRHDGDDQFTELQVLPTGDLAMVGFLQDNPNGFGGYDVHLLQTDNLFKPLNSSLIVYGGRADDQGWSLAVTAAIEPNERYGFALAGWTESFEGLGPRDLYEIRTTAGGKSGCNERKVELKWDDPKFDPQELPTCDPQANVQCNARAEMREVRGQRVLCGPCGIAPQQDAPGFSQRIPSEGGNILNNASMKAGAAKGVGTFLAPRK